MERGKNSFGWSAKDKMCFYLLCDYTRWKSSDLSKQSEIRRDIYSNPAPLTMEWFLRLLNICFKYPTINAKRNRSTILYIYSAKNMNVLFILGAITPQSIGFYCNPVAANSLDMYTCTSICTWRIFQKMLDFSLQRRTLWKIVER